MNNETLQQVIRTISYDYRNRLHIFLELSPEWQAIVLLKLTRHVQSQLMQKLSDDQMLQVLEHLDPDEATDLIQMLGKKRQEKIINQLNQYLKNSVSMLLRFDPETAAGVMSVNYIHVEPTETISEVIESARNHEKRTGKIPTILVVKEGKLYGQLPGHQLGYAHKDDLVADHVKKVFSIRYDSSYEQVISHFKRHPHNKIVVTGDKKQVLGIIYTDDMIKLIESVQGSSLYNFAGVSSEESVYDSVARKVGFRYKWLLINLGTSFLAAFTVSLFNETIAKYVLLAVYMPIVAGMGGNAATQTLAVMVRGLSQNKVDAITIFRTLKNELLSGLVNGIINAVLVILIVYILNRDIMVGIVLGLAMVFNLTNAAIFGTLVPVVMKKLGKDPASSATIFITTATDVLGFLVFLGLATLLLQ